MVIPGNEKAQGQENSSCIWVTPAADSLRDKFGKPQTHGNPCGLYPVCFHTAGCLCVAEREPDEMHWSDGDVRGEKGTWGTNIGQKCK